MQSELAHLTSILGADIGGIFTDIVYYIPPFAADSTGRLIVHKVPGTPKNPAQGLLTGMQDLHVKRDCVVVQGNSLNVGPQSACADPGPACYGKRDSLTVTDANLVLGRIDPAYFLGGRFTLHPERAFAQMEVLAQQMGVSVQEAALGIIRIINASMERAIRTVSLEKGHDPRLFTLLPFGGAGPLHACELAEALSIPKVFIPRYHRAQLRCGNQMAAARIGERRLHEIIARYGSHTVQAHAEALLTYPAQLTRVALSQLPDVVVFFTDYLDNDGWGVESLPIVVHIKVEKGNLEVDFTGTASQSTGCINAVQAVTHSAVLYVVRCLLGEHVPTNQGCLEPVNIYIPDGSLLNHHVQRTGNENQPSAAVAAGNVESSQRVLDALFGALSQIAPDRIPAASQGTMNNLTFDGNDIECEKVFAYYETMGGGMGARNGLDGLSRVHVHMSNTRNTPIKVLEMEMPVQIRRYSLRYGSGGAGRYRGGDGFCRELRFLAPARVTLLAERRKYVPYGLFGGEPGATGINTLERKGKLTQLPGKVTFDVTVGDILSISTPGGGGYLIKEQENEHGS